MVPIYQYHILCLSSTADINCLLALFIALAASCGWKSLAGAGSLWHPLQLLPPWGVISSFHHFLVKLKATRHMGNLKYSDFKIVYPRLWTSQLPNLAPISCLNNFSSISDLVNSCLSLNYTQSFPYLHLFMQILPSILSSLSQFLVLFFVLHTVFYGIVQMTLHSWNLSDWYQIDVIFFPS